MLLRLLSFFNFFNFFFMLLSLCLLAFCLLFFDYRLIRSRICRIRFFCRSFLCFLCLRSRFVFAGSLLSFRFSRSFLSLSFSSLTNFRRPSVKSLLYLLLYRSCLYFLWLRLCLCFRLLLLNSFRSKLHTCSLLLFIAKNAVHVLDIVITICFKEINNFLTLLIYFSRQLTYFHFRHFIAFPI